MKYYVYILTILYCGLINGQNYRITYSYKGQEKEIKLYNLDIQNNNICFYPQEMSGVDSIYNSVGKDVYKMPSELTTYSVHKIFSKYHNQASDFLELKYLNGEYILIKNVLPIYHWNLHNNEKEENNFLLKKATIKLGKRQWIAWYNPNIPLIYGPYLFKDLPGLIFHIYDSEKKFEFQLVGIEKLTVSTSTHNFFETDFGYKRPIYSIENFIKLKKNLYKSPVKEFNTEWNNKNEEKEFRLNKIKTIREELKNDDNDVLIFYSIN